jgi:hypothetical protein
VDFGENISALKQPAGESSAQSLAVLSTPLRNVTGDALHIIFTSD